MKPLRFRKKSVRSGL